MVKQRGATTSVLIAGLMAISCPGRAAETQERAESAQPQIVDFVSISAPIIKIEFRSDKPILNPSFIPGPGVGYTWKNGLVGVFFYPSIALQQKDYLLAPHVAINVFYALSIGVGYQWRWRENNAGEIAMFSRAPMLTFGFGIPGKLLRK